MAFPFMEMNMGDEHGDEHEMKNHDEDEHDEEEHHDDDMARKEFSQQQIQKHLI